jgi:hypothetical protein
MIIYVLIEKPTLTNHKYPIIMCTYPDPSYLAPRRQSEALGSASAAVLGTSTQTSLGEALPELALVLTTCQSGISIDDGITSLDHSRVARLTTTG